jgi:uncharacterized protein YggU (UPF0235/DUF167 family)
VKTTFGIRVTPRSAKPGIGEWKTDPAGRSFLEVRVAAAPADGAANAEVVRLLAKALDVSKSEVRIVGGETARLKRIELPLEFDETRRRTGEIR